MDPFETQAALQERCVATPAFANNYLTIRTHLMRWAGFDALTNTIQWDQSGLSFDLHILKLWW